MPPEPPSTLPAGGGCELYEAGHGWDAVRVQRSVGLAARDILGTRCGALLEDPVEAAIYWFITPGASTNWDILNTATLGRGITVTVPPPRRTQGPGPFWRICPGDSDWLTDADALHAALEDVLAPRLGAEHFG